MFMHYWKLCFRTLLFLAAAAVYIKNRMNNSGELFGGYEEKPLILGVIWCIFAVEMLLRFFPSSFESMGCQKQFVRNYKPTGLPESEARILPGVRTFIVILSWVILNGIIAVLYYTCLIDKGILLLISLAYSVCDMICILFFCPFQTWFMKNRCCGTCRIYNWDFAMMFTPLIFVRSFFTWSLVALSIALLIKWEWLLHFHPERFSETSNRSISCAMCEEKLCHHKTQLKSFWKSQKERLF